MGPTTLFRFIILVFFRLLANDVSVEISVSQTDKRPGVRVYYASVDRQDTGSSKAGHGFATDWNKGVHLAAANVATHIDGGSSVVEEERQRSCRCTDKEMERVGSFAAVVETVGVHGTK